MRFSVPYDLAKSAGGRAANCLVIRYAVRGFVAVFVGGLTKSALDPRKPRCCSEHIELRSDCIASAMRMQDISLWLTVETGPNPSLQSWCYSELRVLGIAHVISRALRQSWMIS